MAKKITAIVSLAVVGIMIIATLIMANITVNHNIKCEEPVRIMVTKASPSSGRNLTKDDEEFTEILNLINSASKERLLTALFSGSANNKAEIKEVTTANNVSITAGSYDYLVGFEYNSPQTLMYGNKKFKDANGNNYYYSGLYFGVKEEEGVSKFDVYVNSWDNFNKVTPAYNYHYYYELTANFADLLTYLNAHFN